MNLRLSGTRLRDILEYGVSRRVLGTGGFLQVSGISFTYDTTRASGGRLVGDVRRNDGSTIKADDTLSVALNAYMACQGGDGYQVPEASAKCGQLQSAPRALDLLSRYIADSLGGRVAAPKSSRVVEASTKNPG